MVNDVNRRELRQGTACLKCYCLFCQGREFGGVMDVYPVERNRGEEVMDELDDVDKVVEQINDDE